MDICEIQQQAAECLTQGQYGQAIALYEQSIRTNSPAVSNYWHLGLAWLLQGEIAEAQAVWLSVLAEATPAEIEGWTVDLMQVLTAAAERQCNAGQWQLGETLYQQILELSEHAEAHCALGNVLAQQGKLEEAIASWQRATALKPDFTEAVQNQGKVFQKLEQFEQAIACYSKALEDPTHHPNIQLETQYNLGLCFLQQGEFEAATLCFQAVIQTHPDFTPAHGDLAGALLQQGRLEEAIAHFKKVAELNPAFIQAYENWANTLKKQKRSDESLDANAHFLKALQPQSNPAEIYLFLGNLLVRGNQLEVAIAVYQKALRTQIKPLQGFLELGKALAKQKRFDEAIFNCLNALELQPESAEVYFELGKNLAKQGSVNEAIAAYQNALELDSNSAEVYCYLGNSLSTIGRWDEAIGRYQKSVKLDQNSIETYFNWGIALAHIGRSSEAIACFQKVVEINSGLAKATWEAIVMLFQQGKLTEADLEAAHLFWIEPPHHFCPSTQDWITTSDLIGCEYIHLHPITTVSITPPKTLDATIHFSFRFTGEIELPEAFVAIVPNGRHWLDPDQTTSAVITPDDQLLADVSPEFPILSPGHPDRHPEKHWIFSAGKLPPVHLIEGTVALLSGLSNDMYFHWMCDILPRIALLHQSGMKSRMNLTEIDWFLVSHHLPFQQETLRLLEIPETKVLETNQHLHIQASRLMIPAPGSVAWMSKWALEFLRAVFLEPAERAIAPSTQLERLYISRSQTANRRVINEDAVIELLLKFGFRSVTLESMSVMEQAALLAQANVVIAPHGSGLTNILFCNPGTKVIELFAPNYVYPCYWFLSHLAGLEYYYLLGKIPEGFYLHKLFYSNPRTEDLFIDLNELLALIKLAGIV